MEDKQKEMIRFVPESVSDFREIADLLKEKQIVCVDFSSVDVEVSRRLVDMLSGAVYMVEGTITHVAPQIYIISPPGIDLGINLF